MPLFSAALLSLQRLQMSGLGVSTSSSTHLFRTRASAVVCHTDGHIFLFFVHFASLTVLSTTEQAEHPAFLNYSLLAIENGHLIEDNSYVKRLAFALPRFLLSAVDRISFAEINFQRLQMSVSVFEFRRFGSSMEHSVGIERLVFSQGGILCLPFTAEEYFAFSGSSFPTEQT
ncbi:uncharacterized protein MONOS_17199 [Monocercomonoides exilis]|uniref:uncharacterized protein n=1 Tax=Monocercomonoides exilis TaxID=2049356 RepID=UPI00355A58AD|nr:hypothetical protein MONOS_17199 [Monocercomonoides exilis]